MSRLSEKRAREVASAEPEKTWSQVGRGLAGPAFIVGGLGVISKDFFVTGAVIVYFGCLILYLEAVFEPWALKKTLGVQCLLIAFILLIPAWFTLTIVTAYSPLNLYSCAMRKGNYSDGENIGGIVWDSHFTALYVDLTNPIDKDYSDLDIALRPDVWTNKVVIDRDPAGCRLVTVDEDKVIWVSHAKASGEITMTATRIGQTMDASDSQGNVYTPLARDSAYRVICSKLPAHSTVRILFATVALGPDMTTVAQFVPEPGKWGVSGMDMGKKGAFVDYLGSRPSPSSVFIDGAYVRGIKAYSINATSSVKDGN